MNGLQFTADSQPSFHHGLGPEGLNAQAVAQALRWQNEPVTARVWCRHALGGGLGWSWGEFVGFAKGLLCVRVHGPTMIPKTLHSNLNPICFEGENIHYFSPVHPIVSKGKKVSFCQELFEKSLARSTLGDA